METERTRASLEKQKDSSGLNILHERWQRKPAATLVKEKENELNKASENSWCHMWTLWPWWMTRGLFRKRVKWHGMHWRKITTVPNFFCLTGSGREWLQQIPGTTTIYPLYPSLLLPLLTRQMAIHLDLGSALRVLNFKGSFSSPLCPSACLCGTVGSLLS